MGTALCLLDMSIIRRNICCFVLSAGFPTTSIFKAKNSLKPMLVWAFIDGSNHNGAIKGAVCLLVETSDAQQQLVLGGEVCMWSETADPSNVQQTIWPRAARVPARAPARNPLHQSTARLNQRVLSRMLKRPSHPRRLLLSVV